jgi:hypothetical protein
MKPAKPRSIHVSAKQWRDKVNGNMYFAARLYADGVLVAALPFQYGYGSQFEWEAVAKFRELGILPALADPSRTPGLGTSAREAGIALTVDIANCLKAAVKEWGQLEGALS